MVDAVILKTLIRTAPNYHVLSDSARSKSTVCVCARCMNGQWRSGKRECRRLDVRLALSGFPRGYARVDRNGTCDMVNDPQIKLNLDIPPTKADGGHGNGTTA